MEPDYDPSDNFRSHVSDSFSNSLLIFTGFTGFLIAIPKMTAQDKIPI